MMLCRCNFNKTDIKENNFKQLGQSTISKSVCSVGLSENICICIMVIGLDETRETSIKLS